MKLMKTWFPYIGKDVHHITMRIMINILIIIMIMMIRSVAGLLIIDVTISSLDINQCDGPRHREGDYLRQSRLWWWWWWWLFQLPSNHGCDRITIKVIIVIMVMIMVVVTNQCSCVLPNSQLFSKFCRELYHIQKYLKAQRIGQTTNMQCTFE